MADEVPQIDPAAYASLAGKLQGLMGELSADEQALLRAIIGLAEEALAAAQEQDTTGHRISDPRTATLNELRSGFATAFGPLVPGFGQGGSGRLYTPRGF